MLFFRVSGDLQSFPARTGWRPWPGADMRGRVLFSTADGAALMYDCFILYDCCIVFTRPPLLLPRIRLPDFSGEISFSLYLRVISLRVLHGTSWCVRWLAWAIPGKEIICRHEVSRCSEEAEVHSDNGHSDASSADLACLPYDAAVSGSVGTVPYLGGALLEFIALCLSS